MGCTVQKFSTLLVFCFLSSAFAGDALPVYEAESGIAGTIARIRGRFTRQPTDDQPAADSESELTAAASPT